MPTTNEEANAIIDICTEYGFNTVDLYRFAYDLDERIGQKTDNDSLKTTLKMLKGIALAKHQAELLAPQKTEKYLEKCTKLTVSAIAQSAYGNPCDSKIVQDNFDQWFWHTMWYLIIAFHISVWLGLAASGFLCFFYEPIYVSMPVISFCIYLLTVRVTCPITRWENYIRQKLGWPKVSHFTHWYVICPLFHGKECNRQCKVSRLGPG